MHLDGIFACFTKNCLTIELFFFFTFKKKIKIQLRKLGQSTSVYRSLYAILQRTPFLKKKNNKKHKQQTQKPTHRSQEPLDRLLSQVILYFLVQEHEAGIYAASCFPLIGLTVNCLLKTSFS